jgi:hypothetical protein
MTDREALAAAMPLLKSPDHDARFKAFWVRKRMVLRLGIKAVVDMENAIKGKASQGRNTFKPKKGA